MRVGWIGSSCESVEILRRPYPRYRAYLLAHHEGAPIISGVGKSGGQKSRRQRATYGHGRGCLCQLNWLRRCRVCVDGIESAGLLGGARLSCERIRFFSSRIPNGRNA